MRAKDAGMRCHCKVVLALVRGTTPTMIAQGGLCAKSQVYRPMPVPGAKTEGGRHDAALSLPFWIGTKAAN